MSKIKSTLYTKGKFGRTFRRTEDTNNEFLYSKGIYPTRREKCLQILTIWV